MFGEFLRRSRFADIMVINVPIMMILFVERDDFLQERIFFAVDTYGIFIYGVTKLHMALSHPPRYLEISLKKSLNIVG